MNIEAPTRAIETRYKGYRFRSRLEARWAVFFDAIGWKWEYEPEGYELADGTRYLPDFRICGSFIEIKATEPTDDEKNKAELLAKGLKVNVVFGIGLPSAKEIANGLDGYNGDPDFTGYPVEWTNALLTFSAYCLRKWDRPGICISYETPAILDIIAENEARAARFEHGETGRSAS